MSRMITDPSGRKTTEPRPEPSERHNTQSGDRCKASGFWRVWIPGQPFFVGTAQGILCKRKLVSIHPKEIQDSNIAGDR